MKELPHTWFTSKQSRKDKYADGLRFLLKMHEELGWIKELFLFSTS